MKVLVIERRSASGQGDNKAAIGGVRATHSDPGKIITCIESLKIFSAWEDSYGFYIGWKEGGYCFPVYTENIEKLLKGMLPIQKKFGLVIDWEGPERIAELIPGMAMEGLRGGTFSPHDGQVSPLLAAVAKNMADGLSRTDPDHAAEYAANLQVLSDQIFVIHDQNKRILERYGDSRSSSTIPPSATSPKLTGMDGRR